MTTDTHNSRVGMLDRLISLAEEEVRALDERRWEDWLALWAEDCVYWAPCWKADETLGSDPAVELSHIYYDRSSALHDRIRRFSDRSSPASNPLPRTLHQLTGFRLKPDCDAAQPAITAAWTTNIFWPHSKRSHVLAGRVEYTFSPAADTYIIQQKKVILNNDYIPTMLDIYCM